MNDVEIAWIIKENNRLEKQVRWLTEALFEALDSRRCWLLHRWGAWKVTERGVIERVKVTESHVIGNYVVQERACSRCGRTQVDRRQVTL